jgi:hypothetical protein
MKIARLLDIKSIKCNWENHGCYERLLKPIDSLFNVHRAPREITSYLYGASALAAAANSGSHLSPLASSFSASTISFQHFLITNDRTNLCYRATPLLSRWRTRRSVIRQ